MNSRTVAGTAAVGAAMAVLASTVLAGGAQAQSLPGGVKTKSLGAGNSVTIKLTGESATIKRAVTSVPTSREVWVSGKVRVDTSGDVKGGTVTAGYIVGCQLNIGAQGGGSAGMGSSFIPGSLMPGQVPPPPVFTHPKPDGAATGTVAIGPGQAVFVPVIRTSINGKAVNSFTFRGKSGGMTYSKERFGVDGCAGHASARAMVKVQTSTDTFKGNVTLYGKPFSLG